MIKQRMVELNYSRVYKSYTIGLKHKETNTWLLVQEDNIELILYQQNTYEPINFLNYATYEI